MDALRSIGALPAFAFAFAFVAAFACASACTYDFTVGRSSAPVDAATAGGDHDGDAAESAAAGDAGCADRVPELARLRALATACTSLDGICTQHLTDECSCDVGVVAGAGAAATSYVDAVNRYVDAGCAVGTCTACGPAHTFVCDAQLGGAPTGKCADPQAGF
jgi:hypothetical protein